MDMQSIINLTAGAVIGALGWFWIGKSVNGMGLLPLNQTPVL